MIIKLPYKFRPRDYQQDVFDAGFRDKKLHILDIIHRRAGKDKTSLNFTVGKSCERIGSYLYLLPKQTQVREVIWEAIDEDGMRFLDHIPPELVYKENSTKMVVYLKNGSRIKFGGSDNYDTLVGTNYLGIVQSEFALHHPMARGFFRPILTKNGGWEYLQGTVRGKNHQFDLYNMVRNNPKWFVRVLDITKTKKLDGTSVISEEDIEEERRNGMAEELIQQEYYCNWNIGTLGAYYTDEMSAALNEGRIGKFEINPRMPVFTFWDIGVGDATAIGFMQVINGRPRFIHYIEANGKGVDFFAKEIRAFEQRTGTRVKNHYGPHDLRNREWGSSGRSRISIAAQDEGIHFQIVPNLSIQDRIAAGRKILPECEFDQVGCFQLIECLREAKREYDEVNKVFSKIPLHNWASHGFDMFTYFGAVWQENFTRPDASKPQHYSLDAFDNAGVSPTESNINYFINQ